MDIQRCLSSLETSEYNSNKFDFILNSLGTVFSCAELTKCIFNNYSSEVELTTCGAKILEELFYEHSNRNDPVIGFFLNIIKSYHHSHVCSTKTAIIFTILLCKRIEFNLQSLKSLSTESQSLKLYSRNINDVLKRTMNLVKSEPSLLIQFPVKTGSNLSQFSSKKYDYDRPFFLALCRGDELSANILYKLILKHEKYQVVYNKSNLIIQMSNMPTVGSNSIEYRFNFKIKNGIFIKLEPESKKIYDFISNSQPMFNSLFIDSNLTYDNLHLGFNKKLKMDVFCKNLNSLDFNQASWRQFVKNILINNNIKVVFVRDKVDNELKEFCQNNSILIFHSLNLKLADDIKLYVESKSLVYLEDFDDRYIFKLKLEKYNSCLHTEYVKIINPFKEKNKFFSVLIEIRFKSSLSMNLEILNHNFKRFENVINDGFCLKGSGFVENFLIEKILNFDLKNELYQQNNRDPEQELEYFNLAKETLAVCFRDYCSLIKSNESTKIYDDYTSKMEAWKIAYFINDIFLNSDLSISY